MEAIAAAGVMVELMVDRDDSDGGGSSRW